MLQIIGGVDRPTDGRVIVEGTEVSTLRETGLTRFRARTIGFVFQQFFLLPTLTALENVELPGLFVRDKERRHRARALLERVGLSDRRTHYPAELSGGEMQRVAIARALINNPKIVLADEPTGNLDSHNADSILHLFRELNANGLTIVMVTHNTALACHAKRMIHLKDGEIDSSGVPDGSPRPSRSP